jgi:hypothetical protein
MGNLAHPILMKGRFVLGKAIVARPGIQSTLLSSALVPWGYHTGDTSGIIHRAG